MPKQRPSTRNKVSQGLQPPLFLILTESLRHLIAMRPLPLRDLFRYADCLNLCHCERNGVERGNLGTVAVPLQT